VANLVTITHQFHNFGPTMRSNPTNSYNGIF
jgi:hypothetical protein